MDRKASGTRSSASGPSTSLDLAMMRDGGLWVSAGPAGFALVAASRTRFCCTWPLFKVLFRNVTDRISEAGGSPQELRWEPQDLSPAGLVIDDDEN